MIRKTAISLLLFLAMLTIGYAQPNSLNSDEPTVTIQDLQPKINYADQSTPFYQPIREKPGLALLSSAIIPGSGQAANKKWIRAGTYLLAEAIFLGIHIKKLRDARAQERRYKKFANNNWSVVTYAKWLVEYHNQNQQISNPYIDELANKVTGISASYDPDQDWGKVDLELLRNAERNTPFVFPDNEYGNPFSHVLPDYGSQQYYELISKYYQFGPGWSDFDSKYQLAWDGADMSSYFFRGADLAETFNDSYRLAGNMVSLLILNHIVSAFDSFLTVKIKNNRLETQTNFLTPHKSISLKYHF
ncbi:hypothetical protein [Fodinibius halophilus]|uniref:DUF5683 domain-containing protein n=1 Tax=Fodinibius halophilus TaxID=1736908 RepID=A0A6M1TIW2_9BACT|nr:hypothetical protein [Fodinibius halophilus]NGP88540.1 hypothetical protein [Fodinibius halophilus]